MTTEHNVNNNVEEADGGSSSPMAATAAASSTAAAGGQDSGSGDNSTGHGSGGKGGGGGGVEVVNDPSAVVSRGIKGAEEKRQHSENITTRTNRPSQQPAVLSTFIDHFTLPLPSSTIRYRNARGAARVVEAHDFQIVIEESFIPTTKKKNNNNKNKNNKSTLQSQKQQGQQEQDEHDEEQEQHDNDDEDDEDDEEQHTFSIRRINDRSTGVAFLRITYAIVTIFWTGFLFVFCLQVLLFLFLNLTIELGITSRPDEDTNIQGAIGSILSIIPFVYGLASAMVIAGVFILDIYTGHYLIRNFALSSMKTIDIEWIFFIFFVLVPLLTMCGTLLARTSYWWIITGMTWFCCILTFYVVFTINIVWYELRACWEVTRNRYNNDNDSWWSILKRSILLRQTTSYSGRKTVRFVAMGTIYDAEFTDKGGSFDPNSSRHISLVEGTRTEHISIKARLFLCKFFEKWGMLKFHNTPQDPPQRIYTIEDVRDVRPYITSYTWSLDKIFCRARDSRFIAIVNGPGAVTQDQIKSSMACSFMGSALVFLILFSILYFLQPGGVAMGFLMTAAFLLAIPNFRSTWRLYQTVKVFNNTQLARAHESIQKTGSDITGLHRDKSIASLRLSERENLPFDYPTESECVYLVTERYRISSPTPKFAWIMFGIEVSLFFIWPFISLFMVGNYPLALLFGLVAGVTGARYYINAAIVLEETGTMDLVDGATDREKWRNQARLNEIVGNVSRGHSHGVWMIVLGTLSLIFLGLFAGSLGQSQAEQETFDTPYNYLPDFSYDQTDGIRYPSCRLTNELKDSPITSMADFTFLAGLAYRGINVTQRELDGWFGVNVTQNQDEAVEEYRQTHDVSSQVSFKLVTHPKTYGTPQGDFAYILIRGTTNNWDMLTDAQLWAPAALMQVLRMMLPFGDIWTPIMPYLINAITTVESTSIESVSFYKDTTAYANYIKEGVANGTYIGVSVTGHSLGGGLSIITGAQAQIPAVGLSGPNTMLTRLSLRPQVEVNDLDKYTFNIVPERDVVPMIDDKAQNYQFIRCEAGYTNVIGCHDSTRSLCEVIYTCGTGRRPALCECVTKYGYPEPTPTGNRTFAEACLVRAEV